MMELKPGVQLNEGGKAYGGLSYNHARSNQLDLLSYKKNKDLITERTKNTADNMRKMQQLQNEEANSKLNKFFHTLSKTSNIAVDNQQLLSNDKILAANNSRMHV